MMKKLNCSSWEQVEEQYPLTSSYKSLQEYFIVFRDWVCDSTYKSLFMDMIYTYIGNLLLSTFIETQSRQSDQWQSTRLPGGVQLSH